MRRAVLLDRDGVLNAAIYNPHEGKLDSPYTLDELQLLPGAAKAVRMINDMGFLVVVASNQPGVAKGKCDHAFLEAVNAALKAELTREGARLDAIYYCLHHPDACVESLRIRCDCRKPKPGLLFRAARELEIDLQQSFMVGDSAVDILAGRAAGCRTILLDGHSALPPLHSTPVRPNWIVENLLEAAKRLRDLEGRNLWRYS